MQIRARGNTTNPRTRCGSTSATQTSTTRPVVQATTLVTANYRTPFMFMVEYPVILFLNRVSRPSSISLVRISGLKSSHSQSIVPFPGTDIPSPLIKGISFCLEESANTRKNLKTGVSTQILYQFLTINTF